MFLISCKKEKVKCKKLSCVYHWPFLLYVAYAVDCVDWALHFKDYSICIRRRPIVGGISSRSGSESTGTKWICLWTVTSCHHLMEQRGAIRIACQFDFTWMTFTLIDNLACLIMTLGGHYAKDDARRSDFVCQSVTKFAASVVAVSIGDMSQGLFLVQYSQMFALCGCSACSILFYGQKMMPPTTQRPLPRMRRCWLSGKNHDFHSSRVARIVKWKWFTESFPFTPSRQTYASNRPMSTVWYKCWRLSWFDFFFSQNVIRYTVVFWFCLIPDVCSILV